MEVLNGVNQLNRLDIPVIAEDIQKRMRNDAAPRPAPQMGADGQKRVADDRRLDLETDRPRDIVQDAPVLHIVTEEAKRLLNGLRPTQS